MIKDGATTKLTAAAGAGGAYTTPTLYVGLYANILDVLGLSPAANYYNLVDTSSDINLLTAEPTRYTDAVAATVARIAGTPRYVRAPSADQLRRVVYFFAGTRRSPHWSLVSRQ